MTENVARFIQYLVDKCEDDNNTTFVDGILASAESAIQRGAGSVLFIQSASANGKHVNQTEKLTCDEVAYACRRAKRLFGNVDSSSPVTFPDFSQAFL